MVMASTTGLGCREGGMKMNRTASFLLGAALPTAVLLAVLASGGNLPPSSSGWAAWVTSISTGDGNGTRLVAAPPDELPAEEKFAGLAELLHKVAMEDRTVIITLVNEAFARPGSLLDIYLQSFRDGDGIADLLRHVLVVAVDPAGFRRCEAVHPHCYLLEVKAMDLASDTWFMSKQFLEIVWTKVSLQHRVLELGYSYLFTDVDIMWFRNPFRRLNLYADMAVSTDGYNGDPYSPGNAPNTGLYYVKSTNRTVEMLSRWLAARSRFPEDNEQVVFCNIKDDLAAGDLQIKFVFLDTGVFGGFCQYNDDVGNVCTMHANCCMGLDNKVHDLRNIAADWKNYTSLPSPEKKSAKFSWTFAARCRASMGYR